MRDGLGVAVGVAVGLALAVGEADPDPAGVAVDVVEDVGAGDEVTDGMGVSSNQSVGTPYFVAALAKLNPNMVEKTQINHRAVFLEKYFIAMTPFALVKIT